jgi:hypothetical protein
MQSPGFVEVGAGVALSRRDPRRVLVAGRRVLGPCAGKLIRLDNLGVSYVFCLTLDPAWNFPQLP